MSFASDAWWASLGADADGLVASLHPQYGAPIALTGMGSCATSGGVDVGGLTDAWCAAPAADTGDAVLSQGSTWSTLSSLCGPEYEFRGVARRFKGGRYTHHTVEDFDAACAPDAVPLGRCDTAELVAWTAAVEEPVVHSERDAVTMSSEPLSCVHTPSFVPEPVGSLLCARDPWEAVAGDPKRSRGARPVLRRSHSVLRTNRGVTDAAAAPVHKSSTVLSEHNSEDNTAARVGGVACATGARKRSSKRKRAALATVEPNRGRTSETENRRPCKCPRASTKGKTKRATRSQSQPQLRSRSSSRGRGTPSAVVTVTTAATDVAGAPTPKPQGSTVTHTQHDTPRSVERHTATPSTPATRTPRPAGAKSKRSRTRSSTSRRTRRSGVHHLAGTHFCAFWGAKENAIACVDKTTGLSRPIRVAVPEYMIVSVNRPGPRPSSSEPDGWYLCHNCEMALKRHFRMGSGQVHKHCTSECRMLDQCRARLDYLRERGLELHRVGPLVFDRTAPRGAKRGARAAGPTSTRPVRTPRARRRVAQDDDDDSGSEDDNADDRSVNEAAPPRLSLRQRAMYARMSESKSATTSKRKQALAKLESDRAATATSSD